MADTDTWEAALQEQNAGQPPAAKDSPAAGQVADDWAESLAQQTAAERPVLQAAGTAFPPLAAPRAAATEISMDLERIKNIPVKLTVELGRTRITIKNLLQLGQGSVIELDGLAGQPLEVQINGYLVAQGEVVVVNDKYGIRLTDIIAPSERIQKLNQ